MSIPFTDKQARQAIADAIKTASQSLKVYSWNCLNFKIDPSTGKADFSDWIARFSYTSGTTDYIHGWIVRRVSRETELLGAGCEEFTFLYEILGVYEFTVGNETTNSDDAFSTIVEAVSAAFNQTDHTLTINGHQTMHGGLQFPNLTVVQAGEKLLHLAVGEIELRTTT